MSSEVLVHAEAAPPAAGLGGAAGQQGVGARAPPCLLHQDVVEAVEPRQPHVGHQVRGEDGGRRLRLVQLHEAQGVQTGGGGHQGRGGGWGGGGEGLRQRWGEHGLGVQRGGGGGGGSGDGVEAGLELQLLRRGNHKQEVRV